MPSLHSLLQQGYDAPTLFSQHGYSTAEIAAGMRCSVQWVRRLITRAGVRPATSSWSSEYMAKPRCARARRLHHAIYASFEMFQIAVTLR